jgi:hypothetical protein
MLSDIVNENLLSNARFQDWAEGTLSQLATALQTPNLTLGHLEELLQVQAARLMLPILRAAAQKLADRQPFCCPHCQTTLRLHDAGRERKLAVVFGSMPLTRDYGWCPKCRTYQAPADQALGLQSKAPASPKVQEIAALLSVRGPYHSGAQDARRLSGLEFSAASLHREAQRQGQRALQLRQQDIERSKTMEGVAELSARSGTQHLAPFTLIIQMDAWNIRERDNWGETEAFHKKQRDTQRWHWVFTGTLFRLDQRGETAGQRRVIAQRGYVATRQSLESFTHQIYTEALLRGLLHAQTVLILGDGAIWIWNLADSRFQGAKQRVDLFHVKEHLHELARTLYGANTPEAQAWLKPLLHYLDQRKNGALDVLDHLQGLKTTLQQMTDTQKADLEREIGYFTTHQQRMDYKAGRKLGEPVGSGVVESTARQYQSRFKCTGQFWTPEGDEALLALATLQRNGRWHLLYPHSIRAAGIENAQ